MNSGVGGGWISRATKIRRCHRLGAAKAVLGLADIKVTEIYYERDRGLSMRVM